jgi:threonine/homoserine/homoserine lactone efflux protein
VTRGFVLQSANPKSFLFFAAILPQFIDPAGNLAYQMIVLGITSIVIEFSILSGYGVLAARGAEFGKSPRFRRWLDRVGGGFLVSAGIGLDVTHQN